MTEPVRQVSAESDAGERPSKRPAMVTSCPTDELSDSELRAVCDLWTSAFPTSAGRDRYAEAVERAATSRATSEMIHAVFEADGRCAAASRTFVRTVGVDGADRRVLALAHVASSPEHHGPW